MLPAGALRDALVELPSLVGDHAVLDEGRRLFGAVAPAAAVAIDALEALSHTVAQCEPDQELSYDLAELAGFGYHTGPLFAAYHRRQGRALARGGRYDGVGSVFGRNRPATGFDVSLKPLLSTQQSFVPTPAIWVSYRAQQQLDDAARQAFWATVRSLRAEGQRLKLALAPGESAGAECDRELVLGSDGWRVEERSVEASA